MLRSQTKEVKQIIENYQYSRDIRKYTNEHFHETGNMIHREINSRKDVESKFNRAKNIIEYFKKVTFKIELDDITGVEKATGEYEIAVCKVIQCCNYNSNDFDYTAEELQGLIDYIFNFYGDLNDLCSRKAWQD